MNRTTTTTHFGFIFGQNPSNSLIIAPFEQEKSHRTPADHLKNPEGFYPDQKRSIGQVIGAARVVWELCDPEEMSGEIHYL